MSGVLGREKKGGGGEVGKVLSEMCSVLTPL